jgi:hypothetical protein
LIGLYFPTTAYLSYKFVRVAEKLELDL